MTTKIIKNSKLSNRQIRKLTDLFVVEVPASKAAQLLKINRHSVDRIYTIIRHSIARECDKKFPYTPIVHSFHKDTLVEKINKQVSIIGITSLDSIIYTDAVFDITREELKSIIRTNYTPPEIRKSESWQIFDSLILDGSKYYKINKIKKNKSSKKQIDELQNFWGYTKTKLKKYHGIHKKYLPLYFKEMQFRFNNRNNANLSEIIKKILIKN